MPIIKSAIKRVRQTHKRQKRNERRKNTYKELLKTMERLVAEGKHTEAATMMPAYQKAVDLAAKQNILNPKTAGRMKSKMQRMVTPQK